MGNNTAGRISRRELLAVGATSAAALMVGCGGNGGRRTVGGEYDVVVVGAGSAGISAARALQAAHKRVLVLEARNRVGGRVFTNHSFPRPFDYGAQFFDMVVPNPNGPGSQNPLYDMAVAQGVRVVSEQSSQSLLLKNGVKASDEDAFAVVLTLAGIDQAIKAVGGPASTGGGDVSCAAAAAAVQGAPFFNLANSVLVNQRGIMDRMSAADYYNQNILVEEPIGVPSNDTFFIPDGYGTFITTLADGLNIWLNTPVTGIDSRDAGSVRVETRYGTVKAKYVVLGVLSAGKIRFQPGLPDVIQTGLSNMPMAVVDKIGIVFGTDVFHDLSDNSLVGEFVDETTSPSFIAKFMGANMASLLVGGDKVLELEAEGKAALFEHARKSVKDTFDMDADKIVAMDCNPWGLDPWATGSWVMVKPGSVDLREQMTAAPIHDRIYLAGEPFNKQVYATAHGAWISGQNAAGQIIPRL